MSDCKTNHVLSISVRRQPKAKIQQHVEVYCTSQVHSPSRNLKEDQCSLVVLPRESLPDRT